MLAELSQGLIALLGGRWWDVVIAYSDDAGHDRDDLC